MAWNPIGKITDLHPVGIEELKESIKMNVNKSAKKHMYFENQYC